MSITEQHQVQFGSKTVSFLLERKRVKHVYLKVRADMRVVVSANEAVPLEFIKGYVKDKASWIINHIERFKETKNQETVKEYVSGETVRYLGKQYRLKVVEGPEEGVKFLQGYIHLYVRDKADYSRKKELLNNWLRQRAAVIFAQSLERVYPKLQKYGIAEPKITIRNMKTRWGSCIRHRQVMQLNLQLIKAPKYCIDYVVLHELAHFKHPNHNKDFYNFLTVLMPDWKKRKAILDEEVAKEL